MTRLIYVSHPEVAVEPDVPVPQWSLSASGADRAVAFAKHQMLAGVTRVVSSDEVKALETSHIIATHLGLDVEVRPMTGEIDRTTPGFVPSDQFEILADDFFAAPETSPHGWETARTAQRRIVDALTDLFSPTSGDVVVVGHGGVGTLLYCHLAGLAIDRQFDQRRGGSYYVVDLTTLKPLSGWRTFEQPPPRYVDERTLEYLRQLGATEEELDDPALEPSVLATRLAVFPIRDTLTVGQLAEAVDMSASEVEAIRVALGHRIVDAEVLVAGPPDVDLFKGFKLAADVFGVQPITDLVRVIGVSTARIADALVSSFLVNVARQHIGADDEDLEMAKANALSAELLPTLLDVIDSSLRRHIVAAGRSDDQGALSGEFEVQRLAIGFVDLVGSTRLTQNLSVEQAGRMFHRFDEVTTWCVASRGGRVVKLIGDEVMFVAPDLECAIDIAIAIQADLGAEEVMPRVSGGIVFDEVTLRDGDVYGNAVNLAARLASAAEINTVLVSPEPSDRDGVSICMRQGLDLDGFDDMTSAWQVSPN
ncbi:MAG: hypothetical protein GXP35_15460 [Actinobacteria bacterium]|nr:hypothetical protein [Actinomycetota bacterium]